MVVISLKLFNINNTIILDKNIEIDYNQELGEIQQYILQKLHKYVYNIECIKLQLKTKEIIIGSEKYNFNYKLTNEDKQEIEEIHIYEIKRDTNGNVITNKLIQKFNQYIQQKIDEEYAKELQNNIMV